MERNKIENRTVRNFLLAFFLLIIILILFFLFLKFLKLENIKKVKIKESITEKNYFSFSIEKESQLVKKLEDFINKKKIKKFVVHDLKSIKVIDGDTIKYGNIKVRLIGIDTPEYNHKQKRYIIEKYKVRNISCLELYGKIAKTTLENLVYKAKNVTIIIIGEDAYGRKLGFLLINNSISKDAGLILLKKGVAFTYDKSDEELLSIYSLYLQKAERNRKGMFGCLN